MPPGLSPVHLLVIFVVALIVLGPDKMPDAMRKGARLLGEARQWSARISDEMQGALTEQTQDLMGPKDAPATPGGPVDAVPPEPAPTSAETAPPSPDPARAERGTTDLPPSSSEADVGLGYEHPQEKEQS